MRPGIWEIILIAALIVILFGSSKIPGMMKNIAEGVKIFKKEVKPAEKPAAKKPSPKKSAKKKK
ncbi:MAG: twin-arginine translocase TatA/TatE family subunit [Rickettsiales bacterium]|jgi:sec-independent protein translocase protein TatA|nr:twin-arginine translocase TatA/TatE family subunit [Rickettsiales bacterium]